MTYLSMTAVIIIAFVALFVFVSLYRSRAEGERNMKAMLISLLIFVLSIAFVYFGY